MRRAEQLKIEEKSQKPARDLCRPACEITRSGAQPWGKHTSLSLARHPGSHLPHLVACWLLLLARVFLLQMLLVTHPTFQGLLHLLFSPAPPCVFLLSPCNLTYKHKFKFPFPVPGDLQICFLAPSIPVDACPSDATQKTTPPQLKPSVVGIELLS